MVPPRVSAEALLDPAVSLRSGSARPASSSPPVRRVHVTTPWGGGVGVAVQFVPVCPSQHEPVSSNELTLTAEPTATLTAFKTPPVNR